MTAPPRRSAFAATLAASMLLAPVVRADGPPSRFAPPVWTSVTPEATTPNKTDAPPPAAKPDPAPPEMMLPAGSAAVPVTLLQLIYVYLDGRSEATATLQRQVGVAIQAKPQACPVPK